MKTGRPSLFNEIDQDKVSKLVLSGWDDAQVADFFGFTEQTFNNWKKDHAEFFESLKDWKREADIKVVMSLYQRAKGITRIVQRSALDKKTGKIKTWDEEIYYPPDPTSMIFWLKNRQPEQWRDRLDPQFYIDKSKHTHYAKINDENLIKQARKSGLDIPDSIKGRIESQSTGKRDKVLQS